MNDLPYTWLKQTYKKEEEEKMKKLITILTIMIVLVGAVFADPAPTNAQIDLTVNVPEKVPTFKLVTFNNTGILTSEVSDLVEEDGAETPVAATFAEAVGNTLADGGTVTVNFAIAQVRPAGNKIKTTNTYTFSVSASALEHATEDDYFAVKTVSSITAIDAAIASNYATITPGESLSIKYKGNTYAPATAELNFAKFSVTWQGDAEAVPGNYTGSVTLTMTTT